jgi:hypothetical protein
MAEVNPVGVSQFDKIANEVNQVIANWRAKNPLPSWWAKVGGAWVTSASFLVKVTDYLINIVEEKVSSGPDKKATVLAAVGKIYDEVVYPRLPSYLLPFNARIKLFLLEVVVSAIIDFIVSKYKEGSWVSKPNAANLI